MKADLHVHTCLSPCGSLDMTPVKIAKKAKKQNISIIGICDHNSTENVKAVYNTCSKEGITVLAGIEITTAEEIHIIGLFDSFKNAKIIQESIYAALPGVENDEEKFGMQIVANELDEVVTKNMRLLLGATSITLTDAVDLIHQQDGIAIAAHINREAFSIIGQIGFIPEDLKIDALELSGIPLNSSGNNDEEYKDYACIYSSDAHEIEDVGKVSTSFMLTQATVGEIKMAFNDQDGRCICRGN